MRQRNSMVFLVLLLLAFATPGLAGEKTEESPARYTGTENTPGLSLVPDIPPEKADNPFLTTKLEQADVNKLHELIRQADRIEVREPMDGKALLYSTVDRKDIEALAEAVDVIAPAHWFYCMCLGDPILHLYKKDVKLGQISNHHGTSIRTSIWVANGELKDAEKWLRWFDQRGLTGPRREVEKAAARDRQSRIDDERWLAAIPSSIRPLWNPAHNRGRLQDLQPLRDALAGEFPDEKQRALALYAWYGSGKGPWNGFPQHETAGEELLLDLPVPVLIAAAQEALTRVQAEGAARLFAGPGFSRRDKLRDVVLPKELKEKLLWHVKRQWHEADEKRIRAEAAFSADERHND